MAIFLTFLIKCIRCIELKIDIKFERRLGSLSCATTIQDIDTLGAEVETTSVDATDAGTLSGTGAFARKLGQEQHTEKISPESVSSPSEAFRTFSWLFCLRFVATNLV